MAAVKKVSPRTKKKPAESPTSNKQISKDYIELRIPRFTLTKIPLVFVIIIVLLAFFLGVFGSRLLTDSPTTDDAVIATTASAAFTGYAKQLGLDEKEFSSCIAGDKHKAKVDEDTSVAMQIESSATPTFYVNGNPIVGALPYEVFKSIIESELTGSPLPTPGPNEPTPGPKQDVEIGHLPILGNKNATVTVVEFSDFQCPFCDQFVKNTFPQLKKDYIDTGKIAFAYRHLPIASIHPNATPAAIASECANDQGKFWEYHDILFQNQAAWANLPSTEPSQ